MPNCFAVASSFFRLLFIFLSQYIVRRFCSGFCSYMHTFLDGINLSGRSSGHATYPSKKATASCTVHRFLYLDRVQCSVASIRIGIVQASARGEQGCRPPLFVRGQDFVLYFNSGTIRTKYPRECTKARYVSNAARTPGDRCPMVLMPL